VPGLADFKYSARSFLRAPALTLALLVTIAVGIGSNASVLGFIRGFVSRNVPLPGSDTLVSLFARDEQDAFGPVSLEELRLLQAQTSAFETVGAVREIQSFVVIGGRSTVMSVAAVTPEAAGLLQLPAAGVFLSRRVWRTELSGKATARGETITIDGVAVPIHDLAPDWLEGLYDGRNVDVWVPLDQASLDGIDPRSHTLWAIARLRPGTPVARAHADLNASLTGARIAVLPYTGMTPEVAGGLFRMRQLLPAAAGAVFLIACANVAAFLLARSSARSLETSVRVALGASRAQLGRQLFADSALVAIVGGACGALVAFWTAGVVPALFFEQDAEHLSFAPDVGASLIASLVCVAITAVCGLVPFFEIRHDDPASVLRRESAGPSNAMRRVRTGLVVAQMACCCLLVISTGLLLAGFRTALRTSAGSKLGQPILASLEARLGFDRPDLGLEYFGAAEQSVSSLPGISSAAWVQTPPGSRPWWTAARVEPPDLPRRNVVLHVAAFTPKSLALVTLPPVAGRMFGGRDTTGSCRVAIVNDAAASDVFGGDAVGRSIEDPSGQRVEIVGVVTTRDVEGSPGRRPAIFYYAEQTPLPVEREGPATFRVPERPPPLSAVVASTAVSVNYFDAMGFTPTAGTVFPERLRLDDCRVGVINQEAAELYFGGRAAGGALIDGVGQRTTIVGVVHASLLRTSQRRPDPAVFLPMAQNFSPRMTLLLGTRQASENLVSSVRRELLAVRGGTARNVMTLEEHLSRTALAPERIASTLVGASAVMALALGVLGMYGAMAESARQRRREIALRIALGAQRWRVIRQVVIEGLRLAAAGAGVGLLASLVVARWLTRVTPAATSPALWVWLLAPLVLIAAVVIASVLPARRAVSVSPLAIMRDI